MDKSTHTLVVKSQLQRGDFKLDINTEFRPAVHAIFGPSGCGKTSLLRIIAGLEQSAQSDIALGPTIWQKGKSQLPTHKRKLAYVSQHNTLLPHMNVRANLHFAHRYQQQARLSVEQVSELCGIQNLLEHRPAELSGGQIQRCMLARALLCEPELLLLDEPFSALDKSSKSQLIGCLEAILDTLSIPVLYVSHSADEVLRLADELLVMNSGQIIAQGPCNEVLCDTSLYFNHDDDASALLQGTLHTHSPEYHLSCIDVDGARLSLNQIDKAPGSKLRLRVMARDVSIELLDNEPQAHENDSSISNHIYAEIIDICPSKPESIVLLKLAWGEQQLLARITAWSAEKLKLHIGQQIKAQIKSAALLR
ncbi:molybdenum ABC transporter ATP-binding protein [Agaribacterium haliotis]|uniref:molybdenum ABC transporter ATP-binding protein n=1 Tax=Agaribacterium haliotis TaxID=2013869 RepID=UPI000BB53226|nr:molybdenum ABC transporter ATP-binding protein [Agaribacterium haliotis]